MTSDAKIGLLLGLVFIFVIAFIINGLPGLHQKDDSNKLTTNMVGLESNPSGIGANERKVQMALDQPATPAGETAQPAVATQAQQQPMTNPAQPAPTGAAASQPAADNEIVGPTCRQRQQLPLGRLLPLRHRMSRQLIRSRRRHLRPRSPLQRKYM